MKITDFNEEFFAMVMEIFANATKKAKPDYADYIDIFIDATIDLYKNSRPRQSGFKYPEMFANVSLGQSTIRMNSIKQNLFFSWWRI